MMYALSSRRKFIGGTLAIIFFGGILVSVPRSPREICSAQHTAGTPSWEICVHKLSI